MSFFARLHFSLLIIRHALVPGQFLSEPPSPGQTGNPFPSPRPVSAVELSWLLANPSDALNDAGKLSLLFPGALPLAAPFLLFRLKRLGFSACRVTADGNGLTLTAMR
ncbi:hypothetical protein [Geomobilimonas luticola]|uniref:DUF2249 domain-containing protein n=1 Tax=Geomobilimonas luticola TaxID=1114878 RepID=A0ABS5S9N4_9BACT|nr:hypothetical protein [Geomobilimonas luticola]MBT0652093.1 hypothetical protein [Geomobilimonas luticola]